MAIRHARVIGLLVLVATLGGCGNARHFAHVVQRPSVTTKREIAFRSPALTAGKVIPAGYTCTQKIWLPLWWGTLPADTVELVLYFGGFGSPKAVAPGETFSPIVAAAGIVGLKPTPHRLSVGALPAGAFRVSEARVPNCPPRAVGGEFVIRLYALSRQQRIRRSSLSSESPRELLLKVSHRALGVGEFRASYDHA
jgi:hypothetical protein